MKLLLSVIALMGFATTVSAAAKGVGEPVLEVPTLRSIGVYWVIADDPDATARVSLEFRRSGQADWASAGELFRAEPRGEKFVLRKHSYTYRLQLKPDQRLHAGSIMQLEPDTAYEIRVKLIDDGKTRAEKILPVRTAVELQLPQGMTVRHVKPGNGGGSGTADDPYRGLARRRRWRGRE